MPEVPRELLLKVDWDEHELFELLEVVFRDDDFEIDGRERSYFNSIQPAIRSEQVIVSAGIKPTMMVTTDRRWNLRDTVETVRHNYDVHLWKTGRLYEEYV